MGCSQMSNRCWSRTAIPESVLIVGFTICTRALIEDRIIGDYSMTIIFGKES